VTVEAIRPILVALLPIALIALGFRLPHGNRDRGIRLHLADADPEQCGRSRHRTAADGVSRALQAAHAQRVWKSYSRALRGSSWRFRLSAGIALIVA